jgi:tetratricopeptide (TPR) repeat protein
MSDSTSEAEAAHGDNIGDFLNQGLAPRARVPARVATLTYHLGTSLRLQRRYQEALDAYARSKILMPDAPALDYNMAITLECLGRPDEAVNSYRAAIARDPLDMQAHHDLNQLLYRLGRDEDFLQSFDQAAALYPKAGALHYSKGSFLFHAENFGRAREEFERAASLMPEHAPVRDRLALTLIRLGEFDAAIVEHETALRLLPTDPGLWANYAETLIRADESKRALTAAEQAMALGPENQHGLAMWGLALRKLGDPREETLNDYENFVQVFELDPPEGYPNMEAFNHDLDVYLNGLHRDRREYLDQTLRNGTQTIDAIFGAGHDLVEKLRAKIDKAVCAYVTRMNGSPDHPLLKRRCVDFRYSGSWSSRLHDRGFHTNHVHPMGWISATYYIAVPDATKNERKKQGWLKFGEPSFDAGFKEPVRRTVNPKPGTLVLFPSYMWHGTVPFQSQQWRTTIACDVVPK